MGMGLTTSMSAEASPFSDCISREAKDQVVFTSSTDDPLLYARHRMDWKFSGGGRGRQQT
jgi:hypothetical protein